MDDGHGRIVAKQQRLRYGQGTVMSYGQPPFIMVAHDGQTVSIPAIAQYASPAIGDRVLLLTVDRTIYATGLIT